MPSLDFVRVLAQHVRAHLDPEDLSAPASDQRVLLRIRCTRLPSFGFPSAVRFDVREDGVTVRLLGSGGSALVERPLADWQRSGLTPEVERMVRLVGTPGGGLDGYSTLIELSDTHGYRGASYWMGSDADERRLCAVVTRAFELAEQWSK